MTPVHALALAFALLQSPYKVPPKEVVELVDAPVPPAARFNDDASWMLVTERDPLPSIADLSRRWLRLAGMRIDPVANAPFRAGFERSLALVEVKSLKKTAVPLPAGARLSGASWSHTGKRFAFTIVTKGGTELWTATVEKPAAPVRLLEHLDEVLTPYGWMPDGESLFAAVVPDGRGAEPPEPEVPIGPNVQFTSGEKSPLRTYQDLLSSPYDEALFAHYATSQLVVVSAKDGARRAVGKPDLLDRIEPAPDGRHLLVEVMRRPFSYLMPAGDFPHSIEVWDDSGKKLFTVAEVPLAENIPIEGVRMGPRNVGWRPDEPATLTWADALDGGDPKKKAEFRDRWMTLAAPFAGAPRELVKVQHRATGLAWTEHAGEAIVGDYDRDRRWTRAQLVDLNTPGAKPRVLDDRSVRDRYGDPGRPIMRDDAHGFARVRREGPWILRAGEGAAKEGARPFLARQNVDTLQTERLWQCATGQYESVVELVSAGDDADRASKPVTFVTRHESPTEPPNYWMRVLGKADAGGHVAITDEPDPQPSIRGVTKQLVTYKRADGVPLSSTLYLPAGRKEGARLPLIVWAYPLEFNDAATAGQVSGSPFRFTRLAGISHLFLVTQGYAVMDDATMPVVGEPETMNDTFLTQIVASAQAAIDKADEMGVADRDRVGVGGHSYGAFMTANLLAHCDLFRAGCARSGAYNRSLTPFGFQSERRTLWEAPKAYVELSPFFFAHQIHAPLLMVHGEADNNPGTFPIQSERLFQAIKGNGGTARLVMLPKESHGYQARESTLDVLAEMIEWFDTYVKSAPPRAKTADAGAQR